MSGFSQLLLLHRSLASLWRHDHIDRTGNNASHENGKCTRFFGLQVTYQYQKRWLVDVLEWSRRIPVLVSLTHS